MTDLHNLLDSLNADNKTLDKVEFKKKYLSKEGLITIALKGISEISKEEKATYGKRINEIKDIANTYLEQKENTQDLNRSSRRIDPTAPFDVNTDKDKRPHILDLNGSKHILTAEIEKLVDIFKNMGFDVLEGKQIDDDYHMFDSLNFPQGHPARDMYDTFRTDDNFVLPAHTSAMQNRAYKLFGPPPIMTILPGRCFRNEATDASHEHTFYQIEGVCVDKNISLANMQATIKTFLETYLEQELEIKVQPGYFPFTEPDCEFVISCPFCQKKGCPTCGHSGWIELMGCGMIHPNVLKEGGIDPQEYSGFAWGFGVDRLVMIKKGIKDIRYLRDGNLNFLRNI
jgi:phenylalanyl-tRNA synthetase alpha chain